MAENKKIGARLVIDGEQEFRSAINNSKTALKELDSELKLVSTQFKDNATSMEALRAKQQVYLKQQEELVNKSKSLTDALKKAQETQKENQKAHEDTANSIKTLQNALTEAKSKYGENSDEVKKLESELSKTTSEYDKQEATIGKLNNKMATWQTDLNNTQATLADVNTNLDAVNESIVNYDSNIDEVSDSTKNFATNAANAGENTATFGTSLQSLLSVAAVTAALTACANAIKEVATAAISVGSEFQTSMSKVEALSGATGDSLESLTNKAKELGNSTMYSASQVADAFSYMSLAGWDTKSMLEGIQPVLSLAASSSMDLATASDIVTDYLTAFGLEAKDAATFADQMAYAMANSNTNVEQLGEAYSKCAATAGSMGFSVEEVTAALSTMANAGIKGSEAGTALNSIMTRLATNTKGCADELEKYGVHVYDTEGNMNSLTDILEETSEVFGTLTDKEQANLSKVIAGTSHYSSFQSIMQGVATSVEDGSKGFADYKTALENCDGAAQAMADTMQDNLQGDITILKSALEGLGIAAEECFDENLRSSVQGATDAVSLLSESVSNGAMNTSLANLSDSMSNFTDKITTAAVDVLPELIDGLASLLDNIDLIAAAVGTTVASIVAYNTATSLATIATEGFTVALEANPIGLVAAGITALVIGVNSLDSALTDANPEIQRLTTHTNNAATATQNLNTGVDAMLSNTESQKSVINGLVTELENLQSKESLTNDERARSIDIVSQLNTAFPELNLAIDEQTGYLEEGQEAWQSYIDTMLQQAEATAVSEKLVEVQSQRLENEYALNDLWNAMSSTMQTRISREAELRNLQEKGISLDEKQSEELSNISMWYITLSPQEQELYSNSLKLVQANEELNGKYELLTGKLGEVSTATQEATAETKKYVTAKEEIIELTEKEIAAIESETKSLKESLEGQVNGFTKAEEAAKHTKTEVIDALKSQLEAMQNWSDNMSELASRGVNDGILSKLASMGPTGAGYVQAFLDMTAGELSEANTLWSESLSLADTTATELVEEYMTAGHTAAKSYIDGEWKVINDGEQTDVVQALVDDFVGSAEWNRMSPELREKVIESMQGMKDAANDSEIPDATVNATVNALCNSSEWSKLSPELQQKILDATATLPDVAKGDPQLNVGTPNAMVEALMNSSSWNNLTYEAKQKILDAGQAMEESAESTGSEAGQKLGDNTTEGTAEAIESGKDKISEAVISAYSVSDETAETVAETYTNLAETVVDNYSETLTEKAEDGSIEEAVTGMTDATLDTFNTNLESSDGADSEATKRVGNSVASGYIDGQQEKIDDGSVALVAQTTVDTTLTTARTGLEIAEDGAESLAFHRVGTGIDDGLIEGQKEKQEEVYTTAETMFQNVKDKADEILTYDAFYEIGQNVGQGLADGILSMVDTVSAAATQLAKAAEKATTTSLQIKSPSRVFKKLGNYVGEGFELGIKDGFADIDKTMREVLPDASDYTQSYDSVVNTSTAKQMSGISELISTVLPQISENQGTTSVQVVLEGDAAGVFKLVKSENDKLTTATGYNALTLTEE